MRFYEERFTCVPCRNYYGLIGEKWKVLIIRDLLTGTKRFGELKKSVTGITQKVLTNNLRQMESSGLILKKYMQKFHQELNILLLKLVGV